MPLVTQKQKRISQRGFFFFFFNLLWMFKLVYKINSFTPEPAMPTPGLGCYSPIGPPDFAHRVSSLPFCNQVSVGNFWVLWLLGLQKPPFLPSAFFFFFPLQLLIHHTSVTAYGCLNFEVCRGITF